MTERESVDFSQLTDDDFEELCFDLLKSLGYSELVWRQGGADSGRDIQGTLALENPLVGEMRDLWFFECKLSKRGVSPEKLNPKIAWADAERPSHLVFLVSSYITNGTRTWFKDVARNKPYAIHVIEGKKLAALISQFPRLGERYFAASHTRLLKHAHWSWDEHGLVPAVDALFLLATHSGRLKYTAHQLAFLWCCAKIRYSELESEEDEDSEEDGPRPMKEAVFDFAARTLRERNGRKRRLLDVYEKVRIDSLTARAADEDIYLNRLMSGRLTCFRRGSWRQCMYAFAISSIENESGEGLEVLIERSGDVEFRYMARDVRTEYREAQKRLFAIA